MNLLLSGLRIYRFPGSLDNIWSSVILGSVTTSPQWPHIFPTGFQILRNHRISQSQSCKSCGLREGTELDGTFSSAFTLEDTVWYIILGNEGFIGGIIEDDGAILPCIVYPILQLRLMNHRTGWIVRETQIDEVRHFPWEFRNETILLGTRHIDDLVILTGHFIVISRTSGHNVGIYIYRIYRVAYCDRTICIEDFLDIGTIGLGTIRYEDFLRRNIATTLFIIILGNGIAQEFISQIRRISPEGFLGPHLINRSMQRLNYCRNNGLGHITDSQSNDFNFRIFFAICRHLFCNGGKKIASL